MMNESELVDYYFDMIRGIAYGSAPQHKLDIILQAALQAALNDIDFDELRNQNPGIASIVRSDLRDRLGKEADGCAYQLGREILNEAAAHFEE